MLAALGAAALCLGLLAETAPVDPFPNITTAGEVTTHSALLWTTSAKTGLVSFALSPSPDWNPLLAESAASVADVLVPVTAAVSNLTAGTTYYYRVTDADGHTAQGRFKTPPEPGNFAGLRFGVSGDWQGELAPFISITNASGRDLDFFVALGDTIYADTLSPAVPIARIEDLADFRAKHREVYSARLGVNPLAQLRASTAWFATIDDHEIVDDFAGGAAPDTDPRFDPTGAFINETALFRTALQAFHEYHAIQPQVYHTPADPRTHLKARLYRHQQYGLDASVSLLDLRSFRDSGLAAVNNPFDTAAAQRFTSLSFDLDPATGKSLSPRTLLGAAQLAELKTDLRRAQDDGVLWKFVLVGEPIQQLGLAGASDRFEGYARERTDLLRFVVEERIRNVVFISADLHGTVVNNVSYQSGPGEPLRPTGTFEVVTGAVAHDRPFGPTAFDAASGFQVLPGVTLLDGLLKYVEVADRVTFEALPVSERDRLFKRIMDVQLNAVALDPTGLDGSDIRATLLEGQYVAVHTYGWTEFEVDRTSHALTVTTYGVEAYTPEQVDSSILTRAPQIVSRFAVQPQIDAPNLPTLTVSRSNGGVEIAWPQSATTFVLQSRLAASDSPWTALTESPSVRAGQFHLEVRPSDPARFFRLLSGAAASVEPGSP